MQNLTNLAFSSKGNSKWPKMAKTKIVPKNANWRRSEANGQVISFFFSNCISLLFIHPYLQEHISKYDGIQDGFS